MMLSRFFFLTAFGLFSIFPAFLWAGDAATLQVLGSSDDGRYFAYEQYGHMDGSGSPYSIIEVIELPSGRHVQESHIEGRAEGESRDLATVRRDALAMASVSKWRIDPNRIGRPLVQQLLTDIRSNHPFSGGAGVKGRGHDRFPEVSCGRRAL